MQSASPASPALGHHFSAEPESSLARPIALDRPGLAHPPSYWAATAGPAVSDNGELLSDIETPVAIIGGGFTGLSCAYHLAKEHGVSSTVLEANQIGWGASGRNGGFAMICVGKDEYADTLARYDREEARKTFNVGLEAVATVSDIIEDNAIDADRSERGWFCVAHRPSRLRELEAIHDLLKSSFGYETRILTRDELRANYVGSHEAHGAIYYPDGYGLHPMKYVRGLARAAMAKGAAIHSSSPVIAWSKNGRRHVLRTRTGTVTADQVLVATAGYTLDSLNPWLSGRIVPAISNIAVTRALSREEQEQSGLLTTTVVSDTRRLVFYYRLLSDGRFLFGARGGLADNARENRKSYTWLRSRLGDMFPALRRVETEFFWRGWVCLSRDKNPHLGTTDDPSVHYSMAYIGNGVALASHFGRLVAGRIAGKRIDPDISLFNAPLPRFEVPALRAALLRIAYAYYGVKDRYL
jgi:glycine/D-amino acid oxidase-like deaminating enzyme